MNTTKKVNISDTGLVHKFFTKMRDSRVPKIAGESAEMSHLCSYFTSRPYAEIAA